MPVIQIDKNGFIKGTKQRYAMKVLTLQSILVKGVRIAQGEQVELQGNDLAYFISRGQVVPVKEDTTPAAPQTLETETQPALVKGKSPSANLAKGEKKLGPKKDKKA